MEKLKYRAQKVGIWRHCPKVSLGLAPAIISFDLGAALAAGYLVSFLFAGKKTNVRGRMPSLVFRVRRYRIHLHHWLVFSNVIAISLLLHFFIASPLLFYGFLGGVVAQGLMQYEDWHTIVQRV